MPTSDNDIRKNGLGNYRTLRAENDDNFVLYSGENNPAFSPLNSKFGARFAPKYSYGSDSMTPLEQSILKDYYGLGDTRFDKGLENVDITALSQDYIQNQRAMQQSAIGKLSNGLAKAGVLAATTFIDTFAGTIGAIFNFGSDLVQGNIHSFGDAVTSVVKNPLSEYLQKINEASDDIFANYRTTDEDEKKWYQNAFGEGAANFWGDHFLKNVGFFAGAYLSGRAVAGGMSKLMKLDSARDIFRGAAMSEGLESATASDVLKAYASGDALLSTEKVSKGLMDAAKDIRNKEMKIKIASALSGSIGESRIEAISNSNDYYNKFAGEIERRREAELNDIYNLPEAEKFFGIRQEQVGDKIVGKRYVADEAGLMKFRDRKFAEINAKYDKYLEEISRETNNFANISFGTNLIITSLDNFGVFGDAMIGGYSSARRMTNLVKRTKDGMYKQSKGALAKDLLGAVSAPIYEGEQEMFQEATTRSLNMYEGRKLNSFMNEAISSEGVFSTASYLKDFLNASGEVHTNDDDWENFALGFLTSLIPLPAKGISVDTEGNKKKTVTLGGELYEGLKAYREHKKQSTAVADALNKIVDSKNGSNAIRSVIVNKAMDDAKIGFAEAGDIFSYKNAELDKLMHYAITFENQGRGDDFKNLLEAAFNITNVDELRQMATKETENEDGEKEYQSLYDGMSDSDILEYFEKTKNQSLETADKILSIYRDINQIYGDSMSEQMKIDMATSVMKVDDRENRIKDISDKASRVLVNIAPSSRRDEIMKKIEDIGSLNFVIENSDIIDDHIKEINEAYKIQHNLILELDEETKKASTINNLEEELEDIKNSDESDYGSKEEYDEAIRVVEEKISSIKNSGDGIKSMSELNSEIESVKEFIDDMSSNNISVIKELDDIIKLVGEREALLTKLSLFNMKEYAESGVADMYMSKKIVKSISDMITRRSNAVYDVFKNTLNNDILDSNEINVDTMIRLASQKKDFVAMAEFKIAKDIFKSLEKSEYDEYLYKEMTRTLIDIADKYNSKDKSEDEVLSDLQGEMLDKINNTKDVLESIVDKNNSKYTTAEKLENESKKNSDDGAMSFNSFIQTLIDENEEDLSDIDDNTITSSIKSVLSAIKSIRDSVDNINAERKRKSTEIDSSEKSNKEEMSEEELINSMMFETGEEDDNKEEKDDNEDKDKNEDSDEDFIDGPSFEIDDTIDEEDKDVEKEINFDIDLKQDPGNGEEDEDLFVICSTNTINEDDDPKIRKAKDDSKPASLYGKQVGYKSGTLNVTRQEYNGNIRFQEEEDALNTGRFCSKTKIDKTHVMERAKYNDKSCEKYVSEKINRWNNAGQELMDSGDLAFVMKMYEEVTGNKLPISLLGLAKASDPEKLDQNEYKKLITLTFTGIDKSSILSDLSSNPSVVEEVQKIFEKYHSYTVKTSDFREKDREYMSSATRSFIVLGVLSGNKNNPSSKKSWNTIKEYTKEYRDTVQEKRIKYVQEHSGAIKKGEESPVSTESFYLIPDINTTAAMMYSGRIMLGKHIGSEKTWLEKGYNRDLTSILSEDEMKNPEDNFAIEIIRSSDQDKNLRIGMDVNEEDVVRLNSMYMGLNEQLNQKDNSNRIQTVWIMTREADGAIYHKGVSMKNFNIDFYNKEKSKGNMYIDAVERILGDIIDSVRDGKEANAKNCISNLKSIMYMYDKYPIYFVRSSKNGKKFIIVKHVTTGDTIINVEDSDAKERLMNEILKKQCKMLITEKGLDIIRAKSDNSDMRIILDCNMLSTDLAGIHNYGASLALDLIEKNDKGEFEIVESDYISDFDIDNNPYFIERSDNVGVNVKIKGYKNISSNNGEYFIRTRSRKICNGRMVEIVEWRVKRDDGKTVEVTGDDAAKLNALFITQYSVPKTTIGYNLVKSFYSTKSVKMYYVNLKDGKKFYFDKAGNEIPQQVVKSILGFKKKFKGSRFSQKNLTSESEKEKAKKNLEKRNAARNRLNLIIGDMYSSNDFVHISKNVIVPKAVDGIITTKGRNALHNNTIMKISEINAEIKMYNEKNGSDIKEIGPKVTLNEIFANNDAGKRIREDIAKVLGLYQEDDRGGITYMTGGMIGGTVNRAKSILFIGITDKAFKIDEKFKPMMSKTNDGEDVSYAQKRINSIIEYIEEKGVLKLDDIKVMPIGENGTRRIAVKKSFKKNDNDSKKPEHGKEIKGSEKPVQKSEDKNSDDDSGTSVNDDIINDLLKDNGESIKLCYEDDVFLFSKITNAFDEDPSPIDINGNPSNKEDLNAMLEKLETITNKELNALKSIKDSKDVKRVLKIIFEKNNNPKNDGGDEIVKYIKLNKKIREKINKKIDIAFELKEEESSPSPISINGIDMFKQSVVSRIGTLREIKNVDFNELESATSRDSIRSILSVILGGNLDSGQTNC